MMSTTTAYAATEIEPRTRSRPDTRTRTRPDGQHRSSTPFKPASLAHRLSSAGPGARPSPGRECPAAPTVSTRIALCRHT